MRKLILKMEMSMDGFVGGPNGELDWIQDATDEGATRWVVDAIWQAGLYLVGRKTFETMAQFWPSSPTAFAEPMNTIPKLVFTRSGQLDAKAIVAKGPSSPEATKNQRTWLDPMVSSDLVGEVKKQKAKSGKNLIAYGGAGFARELIANDLVDEYSFVVHPIALGKGLTIFDGLEKPKRLELVSSCTFASGATGQIFAQRR